MRRPFSAFGKPFVPNAWQAVGRFIFRFVYGLLRILAARKTDDLFMDKQNGHLLVYEQ